MINFIIALRLLLSCLGLTWQPHLMDSPTLLLMITGACMFSVEAREVAGEGMGEGMAEEPYCGINCSGEPSSGLVGCDSDGTTFMLHVQLHSPTHEHLPQSWVRTVEVMRKSWSMDGGDCDTLDRVEPSIVSTGSSLEWAEYVTLKRMFFVLNTNNCVSYVTRNSAMSALFFFVSLSL